MYALLALLAVIVENSMVPWTVDSLGIGSDALLTAHDSLVVDASRRQLWHIYFIRSSTPSFLLEVFLSFWFGHIFLSLLDLLVFFVPVGNETNLNFLVTLHLL